MLTFDDIDSSRALVSEGAKCSCYVIVFSKDGLSCKLFNSWLDVVHEQLLGNDDKICIPIRRDLEFDEESGNVFSSYDFFLRVIDGNNRFYLHHAVQTIYRRIRKDHGILVPIPCKSN